MCRINCRFGIQPISLQKKIIILNYSIIMTSISNPHFFCIYDVPRRQMCHINCLNVIEDIRKCHFQYKQIKKSILFAFHLICEYRMVPEMKLYTASLYTLIMLFKF